MRFSLYSELQLHPGMEPAQLYAEALGKAGYGFYASGIMEQLAEVPYEQLVEDDYVWVGRRRTSSSASSRRATSAPA